MSGAAGGWPYMDFLMTGGNGCAGPIAHCPGQTDDNYKTEFGIWTITQVSWWFAGSGWGGSGVVCW